MFIQFKNLLIAQKDIFIIINLNIRYADWSKNSTQRISC